MNAISSSSPRKNTQSSRHHRKSPFRTGLLLLLIGFLLVSCKPSQSVDPISVVQAAYERLNEGDYDGFMEFLSDDAVIVDQHGPNGRYAGSKAIRDFLTTIYMPGQHRVELSDFSSEGNVVTYTCKIYERNRLKGTVYDALNVVIDGKIVYEGTEMDLTEECSKDPSQAFCP